MRRNVIKLCLVLAAGCVAVVAVSRLGFFMVTGSLVPIDRIEHLEEPVAVTAWEPNGLHLSDGRTVQIPGIRSLPSKSTALMEVTKRGVQVAPDGRVWGLVRVHHWCGNDPVREHIVRVDVSELLTFLRVGEPVKPARNSDLLVKEPGGSFSKSGWRIGEFMLFQTWKSINDLPR